MSATAISTTIFALESENTYVADQTKVISMTLTTHGLNGGVSNGIIASAQVFLDAEEAREIIAELRDALSRGL